MQNLLENTRDNIKKIKKYIESGLLSDDEYKLTIFRCEPGIINDLINDLDESICLFSKKTTA